jgi:hypothetical protein
MPAYRREDHNRETTLYKDDDPSSEEVCPTLHEAAVHVKNRWPKTDQAKACFKIVGRNYVYRWPDIEPNVE